MNFDIYATAAKGSSQNPLNSNEPNSPARQLYIYSELYVYTTVSYGGIGTIREIYEENIIDDESASS